MAKAQAKKVVASSKKAAAGRTAARPKSATGPAKKRAEKKPTPAARKAKPAPKPQPKAQPKPQPKKVVAKVKQAVKTATKKVVKAVAPKAAAPTPAPARPTPAPAPPAKVTAPKAAPAPAPEKRARRPRTRVQSSGAPAAAWLSTDKPRPASFIPAPPRAEAPSAIAAPPASSDRLIRPEDVTNVASRTVPVRIDVEQSAGRVYLHVNPMEVFLRPGEAVEWDFRYLNGADVTVEELVIEFDKPAPVQQATFKTKKPGGARPHRQFSGTIQPGAAGKRIQYTVRAMTPFKTELASTRLALVVA